MSTCLVDTIICAYGLNFKVTSPGAYAVSVEYRVH